MEHARSVGFETVDLSRGALPDMVADLVGRPYVDAGIDCVDASAPGLDGDGVPRSVRW